MNNYSILQDDDFLNCYNNRKHFKAHVDWKLLTWDDVIYGIDQAVLHDTGMHIMNNFGMIIHNAERDHTIQSMLENFSELDPDYDSDARWFISMTSRSETFEKHQDTYDVWYWQTIGNISWKIWDDGVEHSYTLEPNDLLFIPQKMWHQTSSIMPRAGISFGVNKSKRII